MVINFLPRKGFGFIQGDDGQRVFVHYSDIVEKSFKLLFAGEEVEYTLDMGPKGLQARAVVRLNPPETSDTPPIIDRKTW